MKSAVALIKQECTGCKQVCTWFLEIDFVYDVFVHVSTPEAINN